MPKPLLCTPACPLHAPEINGIQKKECRYKFILQESNHGEFADYEKPCRYPEAFEPLVIKGFGTHRYFHPSQLEEKSTK